MSSKGQSKIRSVKEGRLRENGLNSCEFFVYVFNFNVNRRFYFTKFSSETSLLKPVKLLHLVS